MGNELTHHLFLNLEGAKQPTHNCRDFFHYQNHMDLCWWQVDNELLWPDLSRWGQVTQICVSKVTKIGSDNGLLPQWHQAIISTNAGTSV